MAVTDSQRREQNVPIVAEVKIGGQTLPTSKHSPLLHSSHQNDSVDALRFGAQRPLRRVRSGSFRRLRGYCERAPQTSPDLRSRFAVLSLAARHESTGRAAASWAGCAFLKAIRLLESIRRARWPVGVMWRVSNLFDRPAIVP